jgi:hypothetical protein
VGYRVIKGGGENLFLSNPIFPHSILFGLRFLLLKMMTFEEDRINEYIAK